MLSSQTASRVLVLGARGRFGQAAARAFAAAGWEVLAHMRVGGADPLFAVPGVRRVGAAFDDAPALARETGSVQVVVHALNPPYTNASWQREAAPMLEASVRLCRLTGATLMLPGNVYNFGRSMPGVLREETPQHADTVKGQVRVQLEQRLAEAVRHDGVRSVVIRAGDFFGSGTGSLFDQMMVSKLARSGRLTLLGPPDVATPWAYVPDLAETFVRVAARRGELAPFETLHFGGYTLSGHDWRAVLTPIAQAWGLVGPGVPLRVGAVPWRLFRVLAWVSPLLASVMEMHYLHETPHSLDNHRLRQLLDSEPHRPLEQAVQQALADLGVGPTKPALNAAVR